MVYFLFEEHEINFFDPVDMYSEKKFPIKVDRYVDRSI